MLAWCRGASDEFSISTRISIIKEQNRKHTSLHMPTTRGDPPCKFFLTKLRQPAMPNQLNCDGFNISRLCIFTLFSKGNTIITIPATSTPCSSTDISRPVKSTATTRNSRMAASTRRALFTGTAPVVAAALSNF